MEGKKNVKVLSANSEMNIEGRILLLDVCEKTYNGHTHQENKKTCINILTQVTTGLYNNKRSDSRPFADIYA